jgi:hypothetical protein
VNLSARERMKTKNEKELLVFEHERLCGVQQAHSCVFQACEDHMVHEEISLAKIEEDSSDSDE